MANTIDLIGNICGYINILADHYGGANVSIRDLPNLPHFVIVSTNRAVDTISGLLQDPEKPVNIDIVTILDNGDKYSPIYLCVVDNITKCIVDKVPIMINKDNIKKQGCGYVVCIPMKIFENDTTIDEVTTLLKDLYFTFVDFDPNMQYKAEPAIIRLANTDKVRIYTYDLTMVCMALGMLNINTQKMFMREDTRSPVDSYYTLTCFSNEELNENIRINLSSIFDQYANNIEELKDAVCSGKMIRNLLYKD